MINGFKVITLCGSTRFKDAFLEAQKRLTLEGNIVISVGLFGHSGDDEVWNEGVKEMLDCQHLAKIDLADEIFVINVGGYIGESTKREIAYAKSKGKNVSYLEDFLKPGIYGYYSALDKLHELGRLTDEEYKKAIDENEKKVFLVTEEYNVCKGPWPYKWNNIDAIVCGILQQYSIIPIDYYDLKFLYDYDHVYEVRIMGKDVTQEEQIKSIIDTVRSDYINQLLSSNKVVVTLCGSSDLSDLLVQLADCMEGLNVVWQTRTLTAESTEMELSLLYVL